ncbi:TauD/TfdA family dioxygenase [Phaeobacter gallaeciensis]|uniref:TauD/TfdA family dioxygenase n=1 Tax=Phaeobacter gallaeciensis TaxID=60890 RepID=UPI000BBBA850|nr:TauD/TfdA family dioxygenase [Phaeobacter gallaeciensis]ATF17345.1 putative taurine catabolism dioxygenase [Phaeobacter gallaeciensis]ATF21454.1 putative taurine catabolism dioxygenase [Phaeobacter gallaeciensis]
MTAPHFTVQADTLIVTWADDTTTQFPTIWLRDNCPSGLHPETHERLLDLLEIDETPVLISATRDEGVVLLEYEDGHVSRMPIALMDAHRPGRRSHDAGKIQEQLWRADLGANGIPRHTSTMILADDYALNAWMQDTAKYGLAIVEHLPDSIDSGVQVAERVGFLRTTNFGTTFEVINKPDPNNLAYTSVALPLHTDLPNQEVPPGYQFLHCLANEATGGGSLFADGFAMAEDLRQDDPEAFRLLCETPIPFRFSDKDADIQVHRPVITLGAMGNVIEIRYNAHLAGIFDMSPEIMPAYYRAYRAYMAKTRDPKYRINVRLKAGEMVVFDNRRVLHGRDSFDPSTGFRHLHGCYVDRGEFASRLRLLERNVTIAKAS